MASLLEMSDWGGTDAESLEKGITHILSDAGSIPLNVEDFKMKLVCCMSDGAGVHFGAKTGLIVRLSVDDFYYTTTFLPKNYCKIKSEIKSAAHALNIQHYQLRS